MSIKKNFVYSLLLILSQILFPILILPYINRILGPSTIGVFNLVDNIAQYIITIAALGIPIYGVREISIARNSSKDALNKTFSELISINFLLTIFCTVLYLGFIIYNTQIAEFRIYYFLGTIQVIAGIFSLEWYFQGIENFKFIALRTFVIKLLSIFLIYFFVKSSDDDVLYYIITTIAFAITGLFNLLYVSKNIMFKVPSKKNILKHIKPLFIFFTTKFMISIYVTMTTILLGILSTTKDVGLFSLAFRVFNIFVIVVSSLTTVLISQVSTAVLNKNTDYFASLIVKTVTFNIFFGLPTSVFIFTYAEEFIFLLGGNEFLPAVYSLRFFAILVFLIPFSNLFALNILTPLKKEKFFLGSTLAGTVLSVILNLILMPRWGYMGATYAFLCTEILVCSLLFYFANKCYKFEKKIVFLIKTFAICIVFIPIYYFLPNENKLIKLVIGIISSGLFYLCFQLILVRDSLVINYANQLYKRFK
ncbi:hypothetical protein IQ37_06190 [Chryseobacterium piperi]|uniref:Uncharacterized protein n=2 Tax=Chryseobacterium piperi TaxID=558152 RepID=A0A086BKC1_9FLAO|nr:hypothetical protein CJF12_19065 [Chryseobacterium piperi]KFF29385.1 hypothetical protein IQ37_06190 [Chryseobacterium piperi]